MLSLVENNQLKRHKVVIFIHNTAYKAIALILLELVGNNNWIVEEYQNDMNQTAEMKCQYSFLRTVKPRKTLGREILF